MKRIFGMFFVVVMSCALLACGDDGPDDALHAAFAVDDEYAAWACECSWEEWGYANKRDCLDENTWNSRIKSELIQCERDAAAAVEAERTEGVGEYFACTSEAYDDGRRCISDVDQCGAEGEAQVHACELEIERGLNDCVEDFEDDEDVQQWLIEYDAHYYDECSFW